MSSGPADISVSAITSQADTMESRIRHDSDVDMRKVKSLQDDDALEPSVEEAKNDVSPSAPIETENDQDEDVEPYSVEQTGAGS